MLNEAAKELHARSIAIVHALEKNIGRIMLFWIAGAGIACAIRIAVAPNSSGLAEQLVRAAPYLLVVGAPVVSMILAFRWFRDGASIPQPKTRLARLGSWRSVSLAEARNMPLYGVTGIMASLLVGMLMNVPVRGLEFLAAMPAWRASAPDWFVPLFGLMLADVVLLSSLYCIAFVAALRRVPLFPRLLVAVWAIDMLMQITISRVMIADGALLATVAEALHNFLEGNMKKVLISFSLWMPYLLLSKRVNVTFRNRVPA
jgi:hypothetical protein